MTELETELPAKKASFSHDRDLRKRPKVLNLPVDIIIGILFLG